MGERSHSSDSCSSTTILYSMHVSVASPFCSLCLGQHCCQHCGVLAEHVAPPLRYSKNSRHNCTCTHRVTWPCLCHAL
jgi:hypothetical protein